MSQLSSDNAAAICRSGGDNLVSLIHHFANGGTFESWSVGRNPIFLEQVKMDLVALASTVEDRLGELYAKEHDNVDYG